MSNTGRDVSLRDSSISLRSLIIDNGVVTYSNIKQWFTGFKYFTFIL